MSRALGRTSESPVRTPGYTDSTPFPATAALWKYKAIFRAGDQRVGQWSDEVSITVAA